MPESKETQLEHHTPTGDQIRAELQATRSAYHTLVDSLADKDLEKRSGNPAWTIRQLLFHMTLAPRLLPNDVRLIRKRARVPKLPAFLFNRLNVIVTRIGARKLTRQSAREKYDAAHAVALDVLETIDEHEWRQGIDYPD